MTKQKSKRLQLALRDGASPAPSKNGAHSVRKVHPRVRTRIWQRAFLKALAKSPNVSLAAKAAGVSARTAYNHKDDDPEFASAWLAALNKSVDVVEATAFKLASEGEPRLIEFILKAHRPAIYRERIEAAVAGAVIILPGKAPGPE